ncbi:MAG: DUF4012 domain-containing protein [Patescibacteria group bacterium]|nr:DUF4012 domain-containing protein [Patescibacteria group bacterium]
MINLKPEINLSKTKPKKSRSIRRRNIKYILLSAAGLILLLLIIGFIKYFGPLKSIYKYSIDGKNDFYDAQKLVTEERFKEAGDKLLQAQEEFSQGLNVLEKNGSLRSYLYIKTQVSAIDNLLRAGSQTASALAKIAYLADEIITPVKKDAEFTLAKLNVEQKHEILKKISESYPDLVGVKAEIDLAVLSLDQIPDRGLFPSIKKSIEPIKEQLPEIQNRIKQALPAVEILPAIAGYPEEQTYLFLLENNTELRPTGGFIGTYGILKAKDGEINHFKTDNIYNLDNPVSDRLIELPPEPLQKYLNAEKWFMRDSNWSPDFPTSAAKAIWFYDQENGPEKNIHGVIAITPTFIESLLGLTGEIKVNGLTFTAENFTEQLQYQVEQGYYRQGISDADRKEVIGDMSEQLLERILNFPQSRWGELWQTIENHIAEKHLLFYSKNASLQQVIEQENWGGKMAEPSNGDYLFVVDANMASLKSDPGVLRTIDYSVAETADEKIADLTITYNNSGTFDWKSTRYRTYTRVYVPLGSVLLESSGVMENDKLHGGRSAEPEVYDELGRTVFAGFISIEPQETGTLHFRYRLPDTIFDTSDGKQYDLYVQKQGGAKPYKLNIDLKFEDEIFSYEPIDKIELSNNNKVTLKTDLDRDRQIEIVFK